MPSSVGRRARVSSSSLTGLTARAAAVSCAAPARRARPLSACARGAASAVELVLADRPYGEVGGDLLRGGEEAGELLGWSLHLGGEITIVGPDLGGRDPGTRCIAGALGFAQPLGQSELEDGAEQAEGPGEHARLGREAGGRPGDEAHGLV